LKRPKFVPVAGGKAVLDWDAAPGRGTLVVTTILDADMAV